MNFQQGKGSRRGLLRALCYFAKVRWQLWYSRHGGRGNHCARPGVGDGVQLGGGGGHLLPPLHLPHMELGRARDQQTHRVPCPRNTGVLTDIKSIWWICKNIFRSDRISSFYIVS